LRKTTIITLAAGVLTPIGIVMGGGQARATDECLAAPNSSSPPGSHWYYHLERPSQRKCWYLGPEGREVHATPSKVRVAAKRSAAPGTSAPIDVQTKDSSQTAPADKPSASLDKQRANSSVSRKAASSSDISAADEQSSSLRQIELPPMPEPVSTDPEPAASVAQKSVPAAASVMKEDVPDAPIVQVNSTIDAAQPDAAPRVSAQGRHPDRKDAAESAPFRPVRVVLLVPAALAFSGLFAFAVFPSGLRRQICAWRRGSQGQSTEQDEMPANFNDAIAEPNLPDPQIEISEGLKRNLQQVLQTLEAQVQRNLA
jgi:hypothetical protein